MSKDLTARQLWQQIMRYGEFERMPVIHWTGWAETILRWQSEGMPTDAVPSEYVDTVSDLVRHRLGHAPAMESCAGAASGHIRFVTDTPVTTVLCDSGSA